MCPCLVCCSYLSVVNEENSQPQSNTSPLVSPETLWQLKPHVFSKAAFYYVKIWLKWINYRFYVTPLGQFVVFFFFYWLTVSCDLAKFVWPMISHHHVNTLSEAYKKGGCFHSLNVFWTFTSRDQRETLCSNMLLLLFLFALTLGAVSPSDVQPQLQNGNCDEFWFNFNSHCYRYVAATMTWADAELHCVSLGTNLVSIHSLEEQKYVENLTKSFNPAGAWVWIGLSDIHKEGHWMWSDGSAANIFHWGVPQPDNAGGNEHCVHLYNEDALRWNDLVCDKPLAFVCKSRSICP